MNFFRLYPQNLRDSYIRNIKKSGYKGPPEKKHNQVLIVSLIISFLSSIVFFFFNLEMLFSILVFVFMNIFFYYQIGLSASNRVRKMEGVFPDVISLMASNLRAGITIDRAFVMSARKEFAPLDGEILETGKEIATGRDIVFALKGMSKRIDSEKISKIILLIISGLKAGGNISDLLEETSKNMKEKEVIEKKAQSTILMYVIFIFFAVAIGAPILFGLSSVLVEIIINLTSNLPATAVESSQLPFTFNEVPITVSFVIYFSLSFIFITDLISCFVIGLINKGDGKTGLKYFIPLLLTSNTLFFLVRKVVGSSLSDIIVF